MVIIIIIIIILIIIIIIIIINLLIPHLSSLMKNKEAISLQLCQAVIFLYNKSLAHLDIKPANVLVRKCPNLYANILM